MFLVERTRWLKPRIKRYYISSWWWLFCVLIKSFFFSEVLFLWIWIFVKWKIIHMSCFIKFIISCCPWSFTAYYLLAHVHSALLFKFIFSIWRVAVLFLLSFSFEKWSSFNFICLFRCSRYGSRIIMIVWSFANRIHYYAYSKGEYY